MITIIGILIALLLPAVQAAREAARRVQCANNQKQLALGCMGHESFTGRFPTGGWGFGWTGDADCGTDWRQPGGWIYNILPFMEQQPLHDLGMGLTGTAKNAAHAQRTSVPLSVLYCPTRRSALAYPWKSGSWGLANATMPTVVGRSDYAANGGDYYTDPSTGGPAWGASYENIYGGPINADQVENPKGQMTSGARNTFAGIAKVATGIVYCGSMIRVADVRDGASNTFLLGEKYLNSFDYVNGTDGGDNECALVGDNADISRWSGPTSTTFWPPIQDTPGYTGDGNFGSAHASGCNMAFCDGSSRCVSYTIDLQTFRRLCNRKDGLPVDPKQL